MTGQKTDNAEHGSREKGGEQKGEWLNKYNFTPCRNIGLQYSIRFMKCPERNNKTIEHGVVLC